MCTHGRGEHGAGGSRLEFPLAMEQGGQTSTALGDSRIYEALRTAPNLGAHGPAAGHGSRSWVSLDGQSQQQLDQSPVMVPGGGHIACCQHLWSRALQNGLGMGFCTQSFGEVYIYS